MKRYFKAGYYLIKKKPIDFGTDIGTLVCTCSGCINLLAFDNWCLSWMSRIDKEDKLELGLTDNKIKEIHNWTDKRFDNSANVLPDLMTAIEFKNLFFEDNADIGIYSLVFPEDDARLLIEEFAEDKTTADFNQNNGRFELRTNLLKKEEDWEDDKEEFLGYDFISVECDGSFHSFHCYDIAKQLLIDDFSLRLNANGLFENVEFPEKIRDYLNEFIGPQVVPWYIVKVKAVK